MGETHQNVLAGGECAGEFLFFRGTNHTRMFVSVPLSSEMPVDSWLLSEQG